MLCLIGSLVAFGYVDNEYSAARLVVHCLLHDGDQRLAVVVSGLVHALRQTISVGHANNAPVVGYAEDELPAVSIGERHQIRRDVVGMHLGFFELGVQMFAAMETVEQFQERHSDYRNRTRTGMDIVS